MNAIRHLREQAGLTQAAFAKLAGTSQPTIAAYENGTKSPTLDTLERLASSLGFELFISFWQPLTREDRRSLAYHRAVAVLLRRDTASAVSRAKKTLRRMSVEHAGPKMLFEQWRRWLELPREELVSKILDPGAEGREMRQVSPFAGLLGAKERAGVLNRFRRECK